MSTIYLWLIEQNSNQGYDTYDSAIVAARTKLEAMATHPGGDTFGRDYGTWADRPEQVTARCIGVTTTEACGTVVCASINAG